MGNRNQLEKLIFAALLTSIAIVIKIIFNYIPLPTTIKNIDLFLVFIILAGILMGPVYGGLVGFVTDILFIFMAGGNWGLFTVAHTLAGIIPGLYFAYFRFNKVSLVVSMFFTISVYFAITTVALDILGFIPANIYTIAPRLLRTAIIFIPYCYLVRFLVTDARLQGSSIYNEFVQSHNL